MTLTPKLREASQPSRVAQELRGPLACSVGPAKYLRWQILRTIQLHSLSQNIGPDHAELQVRRPPACISRASAQTTSPPTPPSLPGPRTHGNTQGGRLPPSLLLCVSFQAQVAFSGQSPWPLAAALQVRPEGWWHGHHVLEMPSQAPAGIRWVRACFVPGSPGPREHVKV